MNDPAFLQSVLESLPGVDPNSEEIRQAMGQLTGKGGGKKDGKKSDEKKDDSSDDKKWPFLNGAGAVLKGGEGSQRSPLPNEILLSIVGHLGWKFSVYVVVLCQKLHIETYDWHNVFW